MWVGEGLSAHSLAVGTGCLNIGEHTLYNKLRCFHILYYNPWVAQVPLGP